MCMLYLPRKSLSHNTSTYTHASAYTYLNTHTHRVEYIWDCALAIECWPSMHAVLGPTSSTALGLFSVKACRFCLPYRAALTLTPSPAPRQFMWVQARAGALKGSLGT